MHVKHLQRGGGYNNMMRDSSTLLLACRNKTLLSTVVYLFTSKLTSLIALVLATRQSREMA